MPYVPKDRRPGLVPGPYCPADRMAGPGDLNYVLTEAAIRYVRQRGLSYQTINDVLGALAAAAQEFYRRMAVPYEDEALARNGDVYPEEQK